MVFVWNSIWCPVKDRNRSAAPLLSNASTSKVSQQKRISADSLPVLNFDLSSSIIDFDDQIVGDVWLSSFIETTWSENKSLRKIISPPSSRRNLIPESPKFSLFRSMDSIIWRRGKKLKKNSRNFLHFLPPNIQQKCGRS